MEMARSARRWSSTCACTRANVRTSARSTTAASRSPTRPRSRGTGACTTARSITAARSATVRGRLRARRRSRGTRGRMPTGRPGPSRSLSPLSSRQTLMEMRASRYSPGIDGTPSWHQGSPDPYASPHLSHQSIGSGSRFASPITTVQYIPPPPPPPVEPSLRRTGRLRASTSSGTLDHHQQQPQGGHPQVQQAGPSPRRLPNGTGPARGPSLQSVSEAAVTAQLSAFLRDAQTSGAGGPPGSQAAGPGHGPQGPGNGTTSGAKWSNVRGGEEEV